MADEAESADDRGADESTASFGGAGRVLRAFASLLGVHIDHARDEAVDDARRLANAVLTTLIALVFAALGLVFLHLAAFAVLRSRFALTTSEAYALLGCIDFVASAGLYLKARGKFATPVLVRTRALLRRTVSSLTES